MFGAAVVPDGAVLFLLLSSLWKPPSWNALDTSWSVDLTCLPAAVFLHPYAETSWKDQLTKESLVERTVRATVHAKRTLMAGYTAVRYASNASLHSAYPTPRPQGGRPEVQRICEARCGVRMRTVSYLNHPSTAT